MKNFFKVLCLGLVVALSGCGDATPSIETGPAQATKAPQTEAEVASVNQSDIDNFEKVTVDLSGINNDRDFERAVDEAWREYEKAIESVPSSYQTGRQKAQPLVEALRAKDMQNYLAWIDAEYSFNYVRKYELERTVPALKEFTEAEERILDAERVIELEAKNAKRITALRTYTLKVVALAKGYAEKIAH